MSIIGGLALALIIIALGGYAGKRVVDGVAEGIAGRMSGPARKKAAKAGSKARATVIEPVRHIKARAMADVRAQHWLEKKQAARKRREARREARPPRNWHPRLPRVAVHIPGVTDQSAPAKGASEQPPASTSPAQPAPAKPPLAAVPAASPQPSRPVSTQPPTGRPPAMPNRNVPPDFAAVIARIYNTEHESDAEYVAFIRGLAAGFQGIAEALDDHGDQLINGIGLDPAAVKCWHDISSSVADSASGITRAEGQYLSTYSGATEDASNGHVMPFKGRFISGEVA